MIPLTAEMTFPVGIETMHATSLPMGALTLMLNYDPARIEITGVDMPENTGISPWFVAEIGILTIGWASMEPVVVNSDQPLLLIRAADPTRFTLNENPLSEIADISGNVIANTKLTIPDAGSSSNACCLKSQSGAGIPEHRI